MCVFFVFRERVSKRGREGLGLGVKFYPPHARARVKIEIPIMRHGKKQMIETLINEECLLLAKYLRGEIQSWKARIVTVY
jgi:hypothetical protein